MREFDYIDWLRTRIPLDPRILVGPGDDCAVLQNPNKPWLVTTDMLLEGSHFLLSEVGPHRVGRKALAVNLSDIAAMAGTPVAAVVSLGLPRNGPKHLPQDLFHGMRELAESFDTAIVGGDTNSWNGPLAISITLLGTPHAKGPVLRSGAKPGDWLFVTGPLGGSLRGHHLDFTPRVREANDLADRFDLHAMLDLSDGLARDLRHLCDESQCGAVLDPDMIPRNADCSLENALGDGEDFELLFAVSPEDGQRLLHEPVWRIGTCTADRQVLLGHSPLPDWGYEHQV